MKALITTPRGKIFDTFFTPENIKLAESLGEIVWNPYERHLTKEEVKALAADCDVYVTTWSSPQLDAEILAAAPNIKLLTHLCGTVKPFVSDAMWERGVRVICGNDYFALSVAEGTVGYMLAAQRDIPKYSTDLKEKRQWKSDEIFTQSLLRKTVGLVSYGAIAKHLVRMLQPFQVKLKVYDIVEIPAADKEKYGIEQVSLDELFSTCEIISIHTPYFDATHHLINKDLLAKIQPNALLVNTSRGPVIDQAALVEELRTGRFRALLDVYEVEPPHADDPLFDVPNLIMMPHMAGPTINLRQYITHDLLLESAAFVDKGAPLKNEVTKARAAQMSLR